ncbi:COG1470 family protein [Fervidobacterium sp.]
MKRLILLLTALLLAACSTEGVPTGQVVLNIRGLPSGLTPEVSFRGPKTLTVNASGTYELPIGTYTVEAKEVRGANGERYYPEQVTTPVEVKRGAKTTAGVVYALDRSTQPGSLAVLITGLPDGAQPQVTVHSGQGSESWPIASSTTLTLRPGTYLVRARPVNAAGERYLPTPEEDVVVLEPGAQATSRITYSKEVKTGSLLVTITGLPDGVGGDVQVKDGNGNVVGVLSESRLLNLPAGIYFVNARSVQANGRAYNPTVSGSPVQLQPGAQASVQVNYSEAPPPSFTLAANPTNLVVQQGGTGQITLTITPLNGFEGEVALRLQGAPSGVSLNPDQANVRGTTTVSAVLSVASGVTPGLYTLTLKATSGALSSSVIVSLRVPEPSFDFTLSPTSLTLDVGSQATLVAQLTPQNGFSGQVSFSLLGAPAGVSLISSPVDLQGGVSVPLILSVASTATPGTYTLIVQASGSGVSRTQALSLTITPATGALALNIQFNPAPPGAQGYVVVSGPGGYSQTFTNSQVIEGLAPGTYTITAYAVDIGGTAYVPTPPGGTVQVARGATASFTVVYAPAQ